MLEMLFAGLGKFVDEVSRYRRQRREQEDLALSALSLALQETCLYYENLDRGSARDLERERQISLYWTAAAIPVRHIDEQLAMLCEFKSDFWVKPEGWTAEEIREAGIELGGMKNRYRDKLYPRFRLNKDGDAKGRRLTKG